MMSRSERSSTRLAAGVGLALSAWVLAAPGAGPAGAVRRPGAVSAAAATSRKLLPPLDGAKTYYVRPDGGSLSQCTGLADAAYPGSGAAQSCAVNHIFWLLPPGGPAVLQGGDTAIVSPGSYRMGLGAPGAAACSSAWPWDCYMVPVPSGPDAGHPTRILGAGWDTGCLARPELFGAERADRVINLEGSSHVQIECLEITDRSACVVFHTGGLACNRDTYPHGDWAATGIAASDSADVRLRHLNVHGLADRGVLAGRLSDWLVEDVRIAGNGWAGWDGDIGDPTGNTGTMTFRRFIVEWNGCGETYPGGQPTGCWGQTAGGYGDGFGTGATGGDWVFEDSQFLHNTSDGLDLLYHRLGGSVTIRRTRAEGNAGNQLKSTGNTSIVNSVVVGNCGFFDKQRFTYLTDQCRALGNAISIAFDPGSTVTIVTDDPLLPRTTRVKAVHVTELRQAIGQLRTRYGLSAITWTDAAPGVGVTSVKAAHVTELRSALDAVYTEAGLTPPSYTDPVIVGRGTAVKALHIAEIRTAVTAVW